MRKCKQLNWSAAAAAARLQMQMRNEMSRGEMGERSKAREESKMSCSIERQMVVKAFHCCCCCYCCCGGFGTVSKSSALLLLLSFNNQCTLTHTHTHTCVFCKSNEIKCADNALTVDDEQREGVYVCGRESVV